MLSFRVVSRNPKMFSSQATGMTVDWQTFATCKGYTSSDAADQLAVGWSCANDARGLIFSWTGSEGTKSCESKEYFLCVTTSDQAVPEQCAAAAEAIPGTG